ncbi:MAG: YeeE/YedE thiosulfate transporter family protein [Pirellulaceae bacterium]
MGPFVPDIITDELNLIIGFLIGMAFGFVLEQAGFSSSKKLTGLFYGTDFTVLRVFFTAGVTAMSGVTLLSTLGMLDTKIIFIHPTFLYAALLGGAVMGLGFVMGGYCPGTAFCGAAIGKIDAIVFVLGGIVGVFLFGEAYPYLSEFYRSSAFGDLTIHSLLGMSAGQFGLILIGIAVSAFIAVGRLERWINPHGPASSFPTVSHKMAAVAILLVGVVLAIVPERTERLNRIAASETYQRQHPVKRMTADEIAFRILDKDPALQLIDIRSPEAFAKQSLPGALNIRPDEFFSKQWDDILRSRKTKVFLADNETPATTAAALASLLGYQRVAILEGGLSHFAKTILEAPSAESNQDNANQDERRFRLRAAPLLTKMISERNNLQPAKRPVKKVLGGCGI